MLRSLCAVIGLVVALALGACGGGSDSVTSSSNSEVRDTLVDLLVAAARGDAGFAAVQGKLAPVEFMTQQGGHMAKSWDKLTPAERTELQRTCYNQLLFVAKDTTLKDRASIEGALAAGKLDLHGARAEFRFHGPSADGKRTVPIKASLIRYNDGSWRLVTCEAQYGR